MMFGTIFLNIAMRTLVLAFRMTLAFVFTFSVLALVLTGSLTLAFVLTFSMLALVFASGLTLAFMLTFSVLALVFASGLTLAFMLTFSVLALVLTGSLALTFVLAFCMTLALVLSIAMTAGATVLAACGQFLACSGIGLHSISIVTHFADFFAQLVRIGFLGVIIDRDLRRIGIIGVIFHTLEERNIFFETIGALLAFERCICLNCHRLNLCICAQSHYGHQGQQDKFFHFFSFINY